MRIILSCILSFALVLCSTPIAYADERVSGGFSGSITNEHRHLLSDRTGSATDEETRTGGRSLKFTAETSASCFICSFFGASSNTSSFLSGGLLSSSSLVSISSDAESLLYSLSDSANNGLASFPLAALFFPALAYADDLEDEEGEEGEEDESQNIIISADIVEALIEDEEEIIEEEEDDTPQVIVSNGDDDSSSGISLLGRSTGSGTAGSRSSGSFSSDFISNFTAYSTGLSALWISFWGRTNTPTWSGSNANMATMLELLWLYDIATSVAPIGALTIGGTVVGSTFSMSVGDYTFTLPSDEDDYWSSLIYPRTAGALIFQSFFGTSGNTPVFFYDELYEIYFVDVIMALMIMDTVLDSIDTRLSNIYTRLSTTNSYLSTISSRVNTSNTHLSNIYSYISDEFVTYLANISSGTSSLVTDVNTYLPNISSYLSSISTYTSTISSRIATSNGYLNTLSSNSSYWGLIHSTLLTTNGYLSDWIYPYLVNT